MAAAQTTATAWTGGIWNGARWTGAGCALLQRPRILDHLVVLLSDQLPVDRAGQDPTPADQRAITIAEHRQWPDQPDWEHGPDALRFPGLYDIDDDGNDDLDDPLDDEINEEEDNPASPRSTRG